IRLAKAGRPGPVLVDITKDAQQSRAPYHVQSGAVDSPLAPRGARSTHPASFDPDSLDRAATLIAYAERPVILAGHGVILAEASETLLAFAERTGALVALTLLGLGAFPASHPLYLGMLGMHGEAWVNQAVQQADLLIAVGMRFDDRVTGKLETFAPIAKKIHIEIDPAEIGKNVPVDVALIGDAKRMLEELLPRATRCPGAEAWQARIGGLKGLAAVRDIRYLPDEGHLYAPHVIHDLWCITREAQGRTIIVTDVGQHQMWEAQYYRHERPRTLITSGGLGTMGFALPAAIGAKMAC